MESKIVSRGMGRSVAAASAYMSCSRLYNDYDGIQHDYTRKTGEMLDWFDRSYHGCGDGRYKGFIPWDKVQ